MLALEQDKGTARKRAMATGALTVFFLYLHMGILFIGHWHMVISLVTGVLAGVLLGWGYIRFAMGGYLVGFLVWAVCTLLFPFLLPSPGAMYESMRGGEDRLGGGGGFALMVHLMSYLGAFVASFFLSCLAFVTYKGVKESKPAG